MCSETGMCVCVCDALACKHDISRRVTLRDLILGT